MSQQRKRRIRITGSVFFVLYLLILVYLLFFAESYGRTGEQALRSYNLIPFKEISRFIRYRQVLGFWSVALNLGGNVVGFMPFGVCMPVMHPRLRSLWKVVLITAAFSGCVELLQLVTGVGSCDIDDVILNTLGGAVGYLLFMICNALRRRIYG